MFLRCSYFFVNLSLNVLINMVLIKTNKCNGLEGTDSFFLSLFYIDGSLYLIVVILIL